MVLYIDLIRPIASPFNAVILSKPENKQQYFSKNTALFLTETDQGKVSLTVPWAGKIRDLYVENGQIVNKGFLLAETTPDISGQASSQRFPAAVLEAMRNNYVIHKKIGPYRIYLPIQH